jgi:hypothetical protein
VEFVLVQRLENSRLVERFLHSCGEGREGLDGPLSLNIRRILGLVLSNTSKDQGRLSKKGEKKSEGSWR